MIVVMAVVVSSILCAALGLRSLRIPIFIALISATPWIGLLSIIRPEDQRVIEGGRDALLALTSIALLAQTTPAERVKARFMITGYFAFALLLIASLFAPSLPNLAVGLVGIRAWLLFPTVAMASFALALSQRQLLNAYKTIIITGLPALLVGIVDAANGAVGRPSVLAGVHPETDSVAASLAAGFEVGDGRLTRVSSFFPYPLAYFVFTIFFLAVCLTTMRLSDRHSRIFATLSGLGALAGLSSGTRLGLIVVPIIVFLSLSAGKLRTVWTALPLSLLSIAAFGAVTAVNIAELPGYLFDLAVLEFNDVIIDGMRVATRSTTFGLGSGTDTNAARSLVSGNLFQPIGGRWQESVLAKAWIEVGLLGFVAVMVIIVVLSRLFLGTVRRPSAGPLAAMAFCLTAVSLKGSLLDQAPAGIYFWFVVGVCLASLPERESQLGGRDAELQARSLEI